MGIPNRGLSSGLHLQCTTVIYPSLIQGPVCTCTCKGLFYFALVTFIYPTVGGGNSGMAL